MQASIPRIPHAVSALALVFLSGGTVAHAAQSGSEVSSAPQRAPAQRPAVGTTGAGSDQARVSASGASTPGVEEESRAEGQPSGASAPAGESGASMSTRSSGGAATSGGSASGSSGAEGVSGTDGKSNAFGPGRD